MDTEARLYLVNTRIAEARRRADDERTARRLAQGSTLGVSAIARPVVATFRRLALHRPVHA